MSSLSNDKATTKKSTATSIDSIDEFQFKPLTEGLGFHKNSASEPVNPASTIQPSDKVKFQSTHLDFKSSPNLDLEKSPLSPPLPRTQALTARPQTQPKINVPTIEDDSIAKAQSAVNQILKNLNHKKQQDDLLLKNKKTLSWKNGTASITAAFLDSMLVLAFFLMTLIALISVTKIDLMTNLKNPGDNYGVWIATGLLFVLSVFSYMSLFRAYMTYTLGEWAFDQRCGSDLEITSRSYGLKVTLRNLIIVLTGFITLPLISWIIKKDIAGDLSGAHIQKLSI